MGIYLTKTWTFVRLQMVIRKVGLMCVLLSCGGLNQAGKWIGQIIESTTAIGLQKWKQHI